MAIRFRISRDDTVCRRATIERMNDLADGDEIYAGQTLKLPAGSKADAQSGAGRSGAAALRSLECAGHQSIGDGEGTWRAGCASHVGRQRLRSPTPKMSALDAALADEASDEIAKALTAKSTKKEKSCFGQERAAAPAKMPSRTHAKSDSAASAKSASTSTAAKASEQPLSSPREFEWPVEGKIIARFGKDEDGERNDGINIAADWARRSMPRPPAPSPMPATS